MDLPLKGIRVLSCEQYGAGPYGTMFLAQLGAEVIKIEPPKGGDTARLVGPHYLRERESTYFTAFNLNKRSITLDTRTEEGKAILRKLAAKSHVVANNLRGDLPEKLGLTYDALKDVNPAIVCAHLSAYGRDNERANWPGYDYLMQAEAGSCSLTGDPDGEPQRMGLSMVDFMTGTIFCIGLLAALNDAQRTGKGRDVDTDLLSAATHQLSYPAVWYMNNGTELGREPRSAHPEATPSQMYKAQDGYMFVMCQLPKFWDVLVAKLERPDLAEDPRFVTNKDRRANREELTQVLDAIFVEHPMAYWQDLLAGHMPIAPVYGIAQALDNPFLRITGMRTEVDHPDKDGLNILANPIKLNGERLPNRAAPLLGADSEDVLGELGLDADEVAALREKGVI